MANLSSYCPNLCYLGDGGRSPRTPNRGALLPVVSCAFRVLRSCDRLAPLMINLAFCFGGRPAFAVASREAGLVIPAYCLTGETFSLWRVLA
jgi:hypothetical protein